MSGNDDPIRPECCTDEVISAIVYVRNIGLVKPIATERMMELCDLTSEQVEECAEYFNKMEDLHGSDCPWNKKFAEGPVSVVVEAGTVTGTLVGAVINRIG